MTGTPAPTVLLSRLRQRFAANPGPALAAAPSSSSDPTLTDNLALFDQVLSEVEDQVGNQVAAGPSLAGPSAAPNLPQDMPPTMPSMPSVAAAVPLAVAQTPDPLNPTGVGLLHKELRPDQSGAQDLSNVPLSVDALAEASSENRISQEQNAVTQEASSDQLPELAAGVQSVENEATAELSPEVAGFLAEVEEHAAEQAPQEIVVAGDSVTTLPAHTISQPVVVVPITPDMEVEGVGKNVRESIQWLLVWSHKIMKMFSGRVIYRENL